MKETRRTVQTKIQEQKQQPVPRTGSHATDTTILDARARQLARTEEEGGTDSADFQVLEFQLANEVYGFDVSQVHTVCALRHLTPVPCTPAFVSGVINLHGRIVSVIDLGSFFDLPKTDSMNARQVIVLQAGRMEIGVLADAVLGIYPLAAGKLQGAIPGGPGRRVEYVKGVAENRMVVLDAEKILSDPMLLVDTH